MVHGKPRHSQGSVERGEQGTERNAVDSHGGPEDHQLGVPSYNYPAAEKLQAPFWYQQVPSSGKSSQSNLS